jgi:RNA polymerase sigma factor (sigma-70 family)
VAALRAGHPDAFEAIYDRYHVQILAFCRHFLGSREDGEDAAQHVFVAAHRDLTSSDRTIELRPWLYTIARNRCLSMLRTRRETATLEDSASVSTAGLAETVQRREDLRELVADLAQLPQEQREALVLFELGDLSQGEIGAVLGRDAKQVKALVFQARTALMGSRDARELDCATIREELATARGADLLRGHLRRHLRTCSACKEYSQAVRHQRAELALLLPVIPTAGLKAATMAAAGGGGAAGGAAGGGGASMLALGAKGVALKVAAATLLAAGAATTVEVARHHDHHHAPAAAAATAGSAAKTAARSEHSRAEAKARALARRRSSRLQASRSERHSKSSQASSLTSTAGTTSSSASTTATDHGPPASTPVKGANRQSTGHAEKAQHGAPANTAHTPQGKAVGQTKAPNPNAGSGNSGQATAGSGSGTSANSSTAHDSQGKAKGQDKSTTATTTPPPAETVPTTTTP